MAARDLVPLKVDVGLDPVTGYHQYPNFNLISSATRKGMDWSKYLDVHGGGMHYDKTCGHKDEAVDSPYGHQCCCMCVPQEFATEALNLFPDKITAMTPAEFETFHDVKAHAHEPDEKVDSNTLNGLNSQRALKIAVAQDTTALDVKIAKALDPNDIEPGITKNVRKKWSDIKVVQGITLKENVKV